MSAKDQAAPGFKEKAKEEFKEIVAISIYLAFFFTAMTTYTILLLRDYGGSTISYAFGIINAIVIAKVILIGQMAHLGRGSEARPLYQTVFYKAILYSLLVLAFHFVEEFIKRLIHHEPPGTVIHHIDPNRLIGTMLVVFCTFIPLFAFLELRRILGGEKFFGIFFRQIPNPPPGH